MNNGLKAKLYSKWPAAIHFFADQGIDPKIIEMLEIYIISDSKIGSKMFDITRETFDKKIGSEFKKTFGWTSYRFRMICELIESTHIIKYWSYPEYPRSNIQKIRIRYIERFVNVKEGEAPLTFKQKEVLFKQFLMDELTNLIKKESDDYVLNGDQFIGKLSKVFNVENYTQD